MITSIFFIIILFYSIVFHEIAHGFAAYRNGDMTAYNAGRLSLNPLRHVDMFGSIIVPIVSYLLFKIPFGWAKPVPYNPNNIKHKKYAELEVASAGILTNFLLAFLGVVFYYVLKNFNILTSDLASILYTLTSINIFLGCFNLLPFPPADGFSIFSEIIDHVKDFYFNIKNKLSKNREYKTSYINKEYSFRDSTFKIKNIFTSPIFMIIAIFIAINIFEFLVPFIVSFINYLYSF